MKGENKSFESMMIRSKNEVGIKSLFFIEG